MPVTNYYTANGQILAEATSGARTDYLMDALGSVTATVNQSGAIVNTYRHKPYGGLLAKTGVGSDPSFLWVGSQGYRQTGKKYSEVYIRARHYSSTVGRWTTKDPIGLAGGDINIYRYVINNPAVMIDPSGHQKNQPKYRTDCTCDPPNTCPPGAKQCLDDEGGCTLCDESTGNPYSFVCPSRYNDPYTNTAWEKCVKDCKRQHEEKHRSDLQSCCKKFSVCLQQAKKEKAKEEKCREQWRKWFLARINWSECQGWTTEVQCMEDAYKRYCPPKDQNKLRCQIVATWIKDARKHRDEYCKNPSQQPPKCPW